MDAATNQVNDPAFINLQAQVNALVTDDVYLTLNENFSTTAGIASNTLSNFISTVNRLGTIYILAPSLRSTVAALGTYGYVSLPQIISTASTLVGRSSSNLISSHIGLGQYYISSPQLISTVAGFSVSNSVLFPSTVDGLGLLYVSSLSLQSTVAGLGRVYMSTPQLTSTTLGLFSNSATVPSGILSSTNGLGRAYVSSLSLQSTVAGLGSIYISSLVLQSTVTGLGSFGYLSTPYLTSTVAGYSNPMVQIQSTVAGLGQFYLSSPTGAQIIPDQYRVKTKFTGRPIVALALAGTTLFFADSSNIYSNAISSLSTAAPTVFASLPNVNSLASDGTTLYVSYSNMIGSYNISSKDFTVVANTNNTLGFANSSASNVQSTPSTATFRSVQGISFNSNRYTYSTGTFLYETTSLYVCDAGNNALRRIQLSPFSVTTIATVTTPYAVAVDSNSEYAYVTGAQGITKVCLFQSNVTLLTTQGVNSRGIWIDPTDTLAYVTSQINNCVFEVNLSNGSSTILAGSPGSSGFVDGTSALFYNPCGIVYNPIDTCIYVADTFNLAIRDITSKIYYSTILGMMKLSYSKTVGVTATTTSVTQNNFILNSSLKLWLDAADPNGTGSAPAVGTITTWRDKSGNSNHALVVNTATYSNGYIQLSADSYFVSRYAMNSTEHHAFIVFQYPVSGAYDISLLSGMSNGTLQIYVYNNTLVLGSSFSSQNRANTLTSNIPILAEIITTANSSTIYINNGSAINGAGFIYGTSVTQVGGSASTSMHMSEVLLYNMSLTSAERSAITTYLINKWRTPALAVFTSVTNSNSTIAASNLASSNTLALYSANVRQPGLCLWLDGADPSGTGVLSVGSNLNIWVDKSGVGNNAPAQGGAGIITTNGISFANTSYATQNLPNMTNSTTFIVFSNATTGIVPLIGASQGSNVGYEILMSNRNILVGLSYPSTSNSRIPVYSPVAIASRTYTMGTNNIGSDSAGAIIFPVSLSATSTGSLLIAQSSPPSVLILPNGGTTFTTAPYPSASTNEFPNNNFTATLSGISDIAFSQAGFIVCSYGSAAIHFYNKAGSFVYQLPVTDIDLNYGWDNAGMNSDSYYAISLATNSTYTIPVNNIIYTVVIVRNVGVSYPNNKIIILGSICSGGNISDSSYLSDTLPFKAGYLGNNPSQYPTFSHICFDPTSFSGTDGFGDYYYTLKNQVWKLTINSFYPNVNANTCIANLQNIAGFLDSTSALTAQFNILIGIACDSSGNIYVSDYSNFAIRMLYKDPGGNLAVRTIYQLPLYSSFPTTMTYSTINGEQYLYVVYLTAGSVPQANFPLSSTYTVPNILKLSLTTTTPFTRQILTTNSTFNTSQNHLFNYTNSSGSIYGVSDRVSDSGMNPGTILTNYGTAGTLNIGLYYIPSPVYYTGSIQEVIIYNTVLTSGQRIDIQNYLFAKWVPSRSTIPFYALIPYPATTAPILNAGFSVPRVGNVITTTPNLTMETNRVTITGNLYAGNITAARFSAVSASGNGYYFGDGTYVTNISDQRLKEDIRPIENALAKVSSMQAVRYRMYSDPSQRWIGYIAQDLEVILPEVVRTDAEGWKSIQYTNLPALIIEAVKELKEKYGQIRLLLSSSGNPI